MLVRSYRAGSLLLKCNTPLNTSYISNGIIRTSCVDSYPRKHTAQLTTQERNDHTKIKMSEDNYTSDSAKKLIPSEASKVTVIRDITPEITTFSAPFERFGLVKVGGRGTLVKLRSGNLAVFSPTELTPEARQKVQSQGIMKYIIAPDFEHHIFISQWAKAYPEAEIIGMEGLPEKREGDEKTKGIKFQHVFTEGNKRDLKISPEFDAEFDYEYVHAHMNKELVFVHKPTRTMIEADLFFNLPAYEQYSRSGIDASSGILMRLFSALYNTKGEMTGQRRFLWYGPGAKDRKAFAESARIMHRWDYDRVIPCHGDVIESGGKNIVDHILAWYRELK